MSEISISGWANPHAKRLYDDLLSNYNRLIRPVENNTDHLTVKLGLKLSQLIDVVSTKSLFIIIFCFEVYKLGIYYCIFLYVYENLRHFPMHIF